MRTKDPLVDDPTLANRFLAHQVSEDEVQLLAMQLSSNEDAVKELEATARFKVGLQKLQEMGELDALLQPPRWSAARWLALAATIVVVLGAALLARGILMQPPLLLATSVAELSSGQNTMLPSTQTYVMLRRRANADRVVVQLPATRAAIRLRVFPKLGAQPPFRLALARVLDPGKPLAAVEVTAADADGFVTVFADSQRLEVGSYVVVLSGTERSTDSAVVFLVEVVAAASQQ